MNTKTLLIIFAVLLLLLTLLSAFGGSINTPVFNSGKPSTLQNSYDSFARVSTPVAVTSSPPVPRPYEHFENMEEPQEQEQQEQQPSYGQQEQNYEEHYYQEPQQVEEFYEEFPPAPYEP